MKLNLVGRDLSLPTIIHQYWTVTEDRFFSPPISAVKKMNRSLRRQFLAAGECNCLRAEAGTLWEETWGH